jgi:cytochrome b561
VANWYILWPIGIFCGQLVYFVANITYGILFGQLVFIPRFGTLFQRKSGNPFPFLGFELESSAAGNVWEK